MKLKPLTLLLIPLIFFAACSSLQPELGLATEYFPDATYLRDGIVNKYYIHGKTNKDHDIVTTIQYRHYQLTQANELTVKFYNPAMELSSTTRFQFEANKMKLLERIEIVRGDTLSTNIINPDFIDWEGLEANYTYQKTYPSGQEVQFTQQQITRVDSLIEHRKTKVFHQKGIQESVYQDPKRSFDITFLTTYMQGIGLYGYELIYEGGSSNLELIEQMTFEEFQKKG